MAVAKWAAPSSESANLAGTALDSLANGSTSARIAYDNSTSRDLYGKVTLELGSITPGSGGSITLRVLHRRGTTDEDVVDTLESYTALLISGASAKRVIFPMVRLYPFTLGFVVRNDAGAALAATGNAFYIQTYNEDVS